MVKLIILILGSAVILTVSRKSLKDFSSHGFYRFFAFELILILCLMNVEFWFEEPFSFLHLISWLLLICSIYPAVEGFRLLYKLGKPDFTAQTETNLKFENTTALVTTGLYKYIRHPMYASLLYLGWGIFFKNPSFYGIILIVLITFFLYSTAMVEEKENFERFGEEYTGYMKKTKMFIPFVF